jgi:hypothetical protein
MHKKKFCVKDLKNLVIRTGHTVSAPNVASAILTLSVRITIFATFAEITLATCVKASSHIILFLSFLGDIENRKNEDHNSLERRNFNIGHRKVSMYKYYFVLYIKKINFRCIV